MAISSLHDSSIGYTSSVCDPENLTLVTTHQKHLVPSTSLHDSVSFRNTTAVQYNNNYYYTIFV